MSAYLPKVEYKTQFEGDNIKMRLRPLSYGHFLKLLPAMSVEGDVEPYVEGLRACIGDYVDEFTGLKDRDGNALGFDVVLEHAHFLELLTDIGGKLLELSSPGDPGKPAG